MSPSSPLAKTRVLVTGASGQVGSYLRARLDANSSIEASYLEGPRHGGPDLAVPGQARHVIEDLRPDAVIHLAGLTGASCSTDPDLTQSVNVDSVHELAAAAAASGATHFVFASTAAVYGDQHDGPLSEDSPLSGSSAYALSKIAAEEVLQSLELGSFHRVALRIFNVYGDGFTSSLVNRVLDSTPESPVVLRGLDEFVRDYVHASDVAAACEAALSFDDVFEAINIGSGDPVSNRELIARLAKKRDIHVVTEHGSPSYSYAATDKARATLGFSPTVVL